MVANASTGRAIVQLPDDQAIAAWMDAYLSGDPHAFAALFDALGPRVYRYFARMCGNRAMAEDMVQTTFLHVHRARDSYRRGNRVMPWVFAIAQNVFRDELRRNKRRPTTLTEDGELPTAVEAPAEVGSPHAMHLVERALAALPEDQREVVVLHKIEGLSMTELAEILGISSGAARVRAHRAYKAIADFLEEHGT